MTESTGFVPLNANDFKSNKNKVDLGEIEVGGNEEQAESGFVRLADSKQPKDLFTQLDSTVRDMSEKFSRNLIWLLLTGLLYRVCQWLMK